MTAAVRGKLADEPAAREGQIAENVERVRGGGLPGNLVDFAAGY